MSYVSNDVADCVSIAGLKIERAARALSELTNDYAFSELPIADLGTANGPAKTILVEYDRLIDFIEIAQDYVFEVRELPEQASVIERDASKEKISQATKVGVVA